MGYDLHYEIQVKCMACYLLSGEMGEYQTGLLIRAVQSGRVGEYFSSKGESTLVAIELINNSQLHIFLSKKE